MEVVKAADCYKRGSGIKAMAIDGEPQPLLQSRTMDVELMALVRNATEELGFAPRDVCDGVLNLPEVKELHATKIKDLKYSDPIPLRYVFHTSHYLIVRPAAGWR